MVPVASRAIASLLGEIDDCRVISVLRRDPLANLGMAVDALEYGRAGAERVALAAAQGTFQVTMSIGQTPWRELAENPARRSKKCDDRDDFS